MIDLAPVVPVETLADDDAVAGAVTATVGLCSLGAMREHANWNTVIRMSVATFMLTNPNLGCPPNDSRACDVRDVHRARH